MVTTTENSPTLGEVSSNANSTPQPYKIGWLTFLIMWVVGYYGVAMIFVVAEVAIYQITLPRYIDLDIYIPLLWGFVAFFIQAIILNVFAGRKIEHWLTVGGLIWLVGVVYTFAVATLGDMQLSFSSSANFANPDLFILYAPLVFALGIGQSVVLGANGGRGVWVYGVLSVVGMGIYFLLLSPLAIHLSIFYPVLTGIGIIWALRPERTATETPDAIYETGNSLAFAAGWLTIHTIIYGAGIYFIPFLNTLLSDMVAVVAITLTATGLIVGLILAQKATLKKYINQPLDDWLTVNVAMLFVSVPLACVGIIALTRAQNNFFDAPFWTWLAIFSALFWLPSFAHSFVLRRFVWRTWIHPLLIGILTLGVTYLSDTTTGILGLAIGIPIYMFLTLFMTVSLFTASNHRPPLTEHEDTAESHSEENDAIDESGEIIQ